MGDISVDPSEVIRKANRISEEANYMQNYIQEAWNRFRDMRSDWEGDSYDKLVRNITGFNGKLNDIFRITVSSMPAELAAKASQYAQMNQSAPKVSFSPATPIGLSEIQGTNKGDKLKFKTQNVIDTVNWVSNKFKQAKAKAEAAKSLATSLKGAWDDDTGSSNIQELETGFDQITDIMEAIDVTFTETVEEVLRKMREGEKSIQQSEAALRAKEQALEAELAQLRQSKGEQVQDWKNLTGNNS